MITTNSFKILSFAAIACLGSITPGYADDTPLAEEMDSLSSSLKGLRKAETTEEKVKLVRAAQTATMNSLKYLPIIFKEMKNEKEKALATADYKRLIGLTFASLCELEEAYLKEDEEKADEIRSALKALKKESHKKYTD